MVKKLVVQSLVHVVVIFALTIACILIAVNIAPKHKKENSLYELNTTHEGLIFAIAYHLAKPVLELAFDNFIEKNGLTDYLKAQKDTEPLNLYDISQGNGNKAFCGQKVSLQVYKVSDQNLPSFSSDDVTLEIGKEKLKELNLGIIGMKEGGERAVLVNKDSYYVKLVKIHDVYPQDPIMIFDNLVTKTGKSVKCGDEVLVKCSIRKHSGELQVKDQDLKFIVGNKQVPLAIELGVIGMRVGNDRAIISLPDALITTDNMLISGVNFDTENVSIITLHLEQ
jgi:FKBP-type peptidyl-prolyl cis-trans isomerase 2